MEQSKVTIIIVNYHGLERTIACLQSLNKIIYSNYQIIVVDNASIKQEADVLERQFPKITILRNHHNDGFAGGNNLALNNVLQNKTSKYVCLLNNDIIVMPDFLDKAVNLIEQQPASKKVGMIAMRMMQYHQPEKIDSLGICLTRGGLAFNIKSLATANRWLFCPCAGAALYDCRLLTEVGLFDQDFFCYAEDLDLGWRARWAGWQTQLSNQSIVYHIGSATSSPSPKPHQRIGKRAGSPSPKPHQRIGERTTKPMSDLAVSYTYRNVIWTIKKNLPTRLFIKYLPCSLIGQLSIIFLYFWRKRAKLICRTYWQAIFKRSSNKQKIVKRISVKQLDKLIMPRIFYSFYFKQLFK